MTRRDVFPALVALIFVPGTVAGVLWLMIPRASATVPFPNPTHRVAIATEAILKAELATCQRGGFETTTRPSFAMPPGSVGVPAGGTPPIEVDDRFFTLPASVPSKMPQVMQLVLATFTGRTREGREVIVTIKPDPFVEGCVVDFGGDARLAEILRPKIAEALAHPAHEPGSPEDDADLAALAGPNAKRKPMATITLPAPPPVAPPAPPKVMTTPAPAPSAPDPAVTPPGEPR